MTAVAAPAEEKLVLSMSKLISAGCMKKVLAAPLNLHHSGAAVTFRFGARLRARSPVLNSNSNLDTTRP